MTCYRNGGCGPYEMYSCSECPASKPEYISRNKIENTCEVATMYNKKYILEKIEQFNRPNHIYLEMEGRICYLVYLNPGERGWFLHVNDDIFDYTPHRVHTSIVKEVQYLDNQVIVTTQNTRFTFTLIQHD